VEAYRYEVDVVVDGRIKMLRRCVFIFVRRRVAPGALIKEPENKEDREDPRQPTHSPDPNPSHYSGSLGRSQQSLRATSALSP
jgi:hypothetical protein